jgi:hypothetical protein
MIHFGESCIPENSRKERAVYVFITCNQSGPQFNRNNAGTKRYLLAHRCANKRRYVCLAHNKARATSCIEYILFLHWEDHP